MSATFAISNYDFLNKTETNLEATLTDLLIKTKQ